MKTLNPKVCLCESFHGKKECYLVQDDTLKTASLSKGGKELVSTRTLDLNLLCLLLAGEMMGTGTMIQLQIPDD